MSDPRRTSEYRKQQSAPPQPERQYLVARQPGITNEHQSREVLNENVRRLRLPEVPMEPVPKLFQAAPAEGAPTTPPPITIIDRLHKWSSHYVVVSNDHNAADGDPIPNPGFRSTTATFSSITDAYTFGDVTLTPRLASLDERIVILVFGGQYEEDIITSPTNSSIDIVGVGRPSLLGKVHVSSGTDKFLFDNFDVLNADTPEDDEYRDFAGLYVDSGNESGVHRSDIQIKRCTFHGPNMQAHVRRWIDIEHCEFDSDDNLMTGVPSVQILLVLSEDFPPQSKWTQIRDSRISGMPFPGGVLAPTYFQKGYALQVSVVDPDTGDWIPNALSNASGVFIKNTTISGWSSNYGWNLIHDHCSHIEGYKLNDTSGSIHHLAFCDGLNGVKSYTWFNHSHFIVRYCACLIDATTTVGPSTGECKVYLNHIRHGGADHAFPPILAGEDVIDGGNLVPPQMPPAGTVYAHDYSTPVATAVYAAGGAVEVGIISNVTVAANNAIYTDFFEDT